jgi:hypothetical protein
MPPHPGAGHTRIRDMNPATENHVVSCHLSCHMRRLSHLTYGPRGRGLGTRFSFRLSTQKLALRPGQRKPRTPPTDASHAAGRVGCGARRSRAGIGARQQPLWVTHTHQAGTTMAGRAARGHEMAGRGAWRQSHHRRLPRFCSDAVPHRLAMRQRCLLLPCPSGRRCRRRRHQTCVHRRARWRASPVGNAKTHSTPSHDDGVEHKWWLPSPPPPPPPPPWASRRRPRHHIRR